MRNKDFKSFGTELDNDKENFVMKHLFILSTFLFIQNMFAQQVNNIPLNELPVRYIEVTFVPATLTSSSYVFLDYGQTINKSIWKIKERKNQSALKDNKGNIISFDSIISMLNFLSEHNFRLIETFQDLKQYGTDEEVSVDYRKFLLENESY